MARKGRVDRGLVKRTNRAGKEVWWVRLYHQGHERWFGSFKNKTEARNFYDQAKVEQKQGRFFPDHHQRDKSEVIDGVIDDYMVQNNKKSRANDIGYARFWKEQLKGRRVSAVDEDVVREGRRKLEHQELKPQTVKHYLKFLRQMLNWAVKEKRLAKNPLTEITMPSVDPIPEGGTRFLSQVEEEKLLSALGAKYAPWARLAILTGMRSGEQFSMKWTDVNLDVGIVTLPTTKSGGVQYVTLSDEAKLILRGFTSWERSKWVFPSRNPATHHNVRNFYRRVWMPAVKDVGLKGLRWHDLRHTFASRAAMSGATPNTIAALLRHSGLALVQRYAHLSREHLGREVERVSNYGKEILTGAKTGTTDREGL